MLKYTFLAIAIFVFKLNGAFAQWKKLSAIPNRHIVALSASGSTIYAASDSNIIYASNDAGNKWYTILVSKQPIRISTLKLINDTIHVGTFANGIFSSYDKGITWLNSGNNLSIISGIEKKGGHLYTSTLGDGIFIYNPNSNKWNPINDSIPTYSVNVTTLLGTPTCLLAGAGANGTLYRYNSATNSWGEELYYGILRPGLMIEKLINSKDTIFAVNGNRIIRSEDNGLHWIDDNIDTHNGNDRTISLGASNYYTITNVLPKGIWIQSRNRYSSAGISWNINEEFMTAGYAYDLLEYNDRLFLAKADGLYAKDLTLNTNHPFSPHSFIKIFPNPANTSGINVSSKIPVHAFTIFDISSKSVTYRQVDGCEFEIQDTLISGIYFIHFYLENGEHIVRKIIVE